MRTKHKLPHTRNRNEGKHKSSPFLASSLLAGAVVTCRKLGILVPFVFAALYCSSSNEIVYKYYDLSILNVTINHTVRHLFPTKPLRKSLLDKIKNATAVDIASDTPFRKMMFELLNETFREHPFKGALDRHGNPGYVHDETSLRRAPPTLPSFNEIELKSVCEKLDKELRVLRKFEVATDGMIEQERARQVARGVAANRVKIFCAVYSTDSEHTKSIQIIRQTWGSQCDGFMVGSNKTDTEYDAVNILHQGKEKYNNMWQKVRSMWAYVYEHYYDKYDWFHMGGDDMYLVVQNLRLYLESEEIRTAANGGVYLPQRHQKYQLPLYLGCRLKRNNDTSDIYNSGGPGYTLNKAALKLLVEEGLPKYLTSVRASYEDLFVGQILRNFSVFPYDTQDENGSERYLPLEPHGHFSYRPERDTWYNNNRFGIDFKRGFDCCSSRTVAMHDIRNEQLYKVHGIMNVVCGKQDYIESYEKYKI